jgi:hypothetical protein
MRTPCSERRAARNLPCALSILLLIAAAGCGRSKPAPAPAERPPVQLHEWPRGSAVPVKITDELCLAIPLQFVRSAVDTTPGAGAPVAAAAPSAGERREAHFDFFLPGFSGYTLHNYRNRSDDNKVEVLYLHAGNPHEADPDAPGEYPPNMLQRSLKQGLLDPKPFQDQYGLSCYRSRVFTDRITCYGQRHPPGGEGIMLTVGLSVPEMQARYFSKRYGGVRIAWRTDAKNLPSWREIDAQIWKFIDDWNVAQAEHSGQPVPAHGT